MRRVVVWGVGEGVMVARGAGGGVGAILSLPACVLLGVCGRVPPFGRVGLCGTSLRSGPRKASDGLRPPFHPSRVRCANLGQLVALAGCCGRWAMVGTGADSVAV